jgi:DNA-binding CsgD family transcriptional regulator
MDELEQIEQPPSDEPVTEPSPEERALSTPRKRRRYEPLSFPKTKPSSIDKHPKRAHIERELLKGQKTLAQISRQYKLNPASVQRHKKRLFAQLEHAQELQAQYLKDRAKRIVGQVDELHTELFEATKSAKGEGDWKGMAAVAGKALDSRKLAAEIDGVLPGQGTGSGEGLPPGMSLTQINAETVNQIIGVPKARKDKPERVVDITPQSAG